MRTIVKNIKELVGCGVSMPDRLVGNQMKCIGSLKNSYVLIDKGLIVEYGAMDSYNVPELGAYIIDATGRYVLPGFVDSHTHLVYAGSREREYEDKIAGLSYVEIANRGGGILNSAKLLHATSEQELYRLSMRRVREAMHGGTCAIEIKSGYGLNLEDELKMLRVIRRIKESSIIEIKSTFLGAHAFPEKYAKNRDGYVNLIVEQMLPAIAEEGLADYVDVFCDDGFFTPTQTRRILDHAAKYGIPPKIHANELACSGGIEVGVEMKARSVDHLEYVGSKQIDMLKNSQTMATLLPGASFFLGMPYAPARELIDGGASVALASDFNPGSSPSSSMKFILSLASIKMRMTIIEAINAATLNGAYAMGISDTHGSVTPGKRANLIITKPMPSLSFFTYSYTADLIERVIFN